TCAGLRTPTAISAGRLTTGGEAVPVARGTWDSVTPFVLSLKSTEIPSGSIDAVAPKVRRAATHGTFTACADLALEAKIFWKSPVTRTSAPSLSPLSELTKLDS